jgi:hypothetical protein
MTEREPGMNLVLLGTPLFLLFAFRLAAQTYTGAMPPKPDLPYLLHADELVATEGTEAKQTDTKDGTTYTIPGSASPVKTPLASPIFLIKADKLVADKLQLFALRPAGNRREITFSRKKKNPESYTFTVKPLGSNVYRMEVNESLPKGEYSLTPGDSNLAFCFAVY